MRVQVVNAIANNLRGHTLGSYPHKVKVQPGPGGTLRVLVERDEFPDRHFTVQVRANYGGWK